MNLSDIILGPRNLLRNEKLDFLKENGFSEEEAKSLYVFQKIYNRAKLAVLVGVGAVFYGYSARKGLQLISRKYNAQILVIGTLTAAVLITDYYLANRRGANTPISNLYTNNLLTTNIKSLNRNFIPFNRKFTEEEKEQMIYNYNLQTLGRKKYTYNKFVHGDDEEAHKMKHERFNSGENVMTLDKIQLIKKLNESKINNGEVVTEKPVKIIKIVSDDGMSIDVKKFNWWRKTEFI